MTQQEENMRILKDILRDLEKHSKQCNLEDYFDDVLETKFVVNENGEFESVILTLGFGGPNIYLDTHYSELRIYWGGSTTALYPSADLINEIDDIFRRYYCRT